MRDGSVQLQLGAFPGHLARAPPAPHPAVVRELARSVRQQSAAASRQPWRTPPPLPPSAQRVFASLLTDSCLPLPPHSVTRQPARPFQNRRTHPRSSANLHDASSGDEQTPSHAASASAGNHLPAASAVASPSKPFFSHHQRHLRSIEDAARLLTAAIKQCRGWQQLQDTLQAQGAAVVNHIHLSAALTHLAQKHKAAALPDPIFSSDELLVALPQHQPPLQQQQQQLLHPTSPGSGISTPAAPAASRLTDGEAALAMTLAAAAALPPHAAALTPRQLSNLLWAASTLGIDPGPAWWDLLVGRLLQLQDSCGGQDLANAMYACAFRPAARSAATAAASSNPQVSNTAAGPAEEQATDSPHQRPLTSSLLPGSGTHRYGEPATAMTLLAAASTRHLHAFRPQELSSTAYALAHASVLPDGRWRTAFLASCQRQLAHFTPQACANLTWSLSRLSLLPSREWLTHFADCTQARLTLFSGPHLAATLWGLGQLRVEMPSAWVDEAMRAALRCDLTPRTVANMLGALAAMGCRPPHAWLHEVLERALPPPPRVSVPARNAGGSSISDAGSSGSSSGPGQRGSGALGGLHSRPVAVPPRMAPARLVAPPKAPPPPADLARGGRMLADSPSRQDSPVGHSASSPPTAGLNRLSSPALTSSEIDRSLAAGQVTMSDYGWEPAAGEPPAGHPRAPLFAPAPALRGVGTDVPPSCSCQDAVGILSACVAMQYTPPARVAHAAAVAMHSSMLDVLRTAARTGDEGVAALAGAASLGGEGSSERVAVAAAELEVDGLWALARIGCRPPLMWLQVYWASSSRHLDVLPGGKLCRLLWAVVKLQARPPSAWLTRILDRLLTLCEATATQHGVDHRRNVDSGSTKSSSSSPTSSSSSSSSGVGAGRAAGRDLLNNHSSSSSSSSSSSGRSSGDDSSGDDSSSSSDRGTLNASELAELIWSLGQLRVTLPAALRQAVAEAFQSHLPNATTAQMALVMQSLPWLGYNRRQDHTRFLDAMLLRSRGMMRTMPPRELTCLAWGAWRMGRVPPAKWMAGVVRQAETRLPEFSPHDMSKMVYALAALTTSSTSRTDQAAASPAQQNPREIPATATASNSNGGSSGSSIGGSRSSSSSISGAAPGARVQMQQAASKPAGTAVAASSSNKGGSGSSNSSSDGNGGGGGDGSRQVDGSSGSSDGGSTRGDACPATSALRRRLLRLCDGRFAEFGLFDLQMVLQASLDRDERWWAAFHTGTMAQVATWPSQPLVDLLFQRARYPEVPLPAEWMELLLSRVSADFASLTSRGVARLLCATVRLRGRPDQSWLQRLMMQVEMNSATLRQADHAVIRRAWLCLHSSATSATRRPPAAARKTPSPRRPVPRRPAIARSSHRLRRLATTARPDANSAGQPGQLEGPPLTRSAPASGGPPPGSSTSGPAAVAGAAGSVRWVLRERGPAEASGRVWRGPGSHKAQGTGFLTPPTGFRGSAAWNSNGGRTGFRRWMPRLRQLPPPPRKKKPRRRRRPPVVVGEP